MHLTVIYNNAIKLQHFTLILKKEHVVLLRNEGKGPTFHQNRGPTSLVSSMGKIYEKVLLNSLCWRGNSSLRNSSALWRVVLQLITFSCFLTVSEVFNKKESTIAVFMNTIKLYTIWHKGLKYELTSVRL